MYILLAWFLVGFVDACIVRHMFGPMRVSRWVALSILGPIPPVIHFWDSVIVKVLDKEI